LGVAISVLASASTQLIFAGNGRMLMCTRDVMWLIQHGKFFA